MADEIKIAKVALSLHKNEDDGKEYVTIFPDEDQKTDGKILAKQWIQNHFENDSEIKTGVVNFDLDNWRKDWGKRFVKNISNNGLMIVWRDLSKDKKIMKGLAPGGGPSIEGGGGLGLGGNEPPSLKTPQPPSLPTPTPGSTPSGSEKPLNAHYEDDNNKTTFREYIDRVIKRVRKSGPLRKIGIKSILGNPRLEIPLTGDIKKDRERRYKELDGKF